MRNRFDEQLFELNRELIEMGSLCEEAIASVAKALTTGDVELAKKVLAENLRQRAHKEAKILADAQALAEKIENLAFTLTAKAEEEKIFGSITSADLAAALAEKGIEVDRKTITLDAVKTLGEYEATVKLHKEVKATVHFSVVAE